MSAPKRAVGYVRVSTKMQVEEGYSIEAQKQTIQDYCFRKGWWLTGYYIDEGLSGKDMKRPQLRKMLEELEGGTTVVAVALSRLTRDSGDYAAIAKTIAMKGCSLTHLDTPNVDTTTPEGDAMVGMMAVFAQLERKQGADRISAVMQNMSREGTLRIKPRYGYKIVVKETVKETVPNPEEQAVIEKIRGMIAAEPRIAVAKIVRELTREGIKMRKAKRIYPSQVKRIIDDNQLRATRTNCTA